MDCFVPVTPSPAVPTISASGGSGLAVTGSTLDILLACIVAVVLLVSGAVALAHARRRRRSQVSRTHSGTTAGMSVALSSVLGLVLLLGAAIPTPAAHADTAQQCNAIAVSDVQIDSSALVDGALQLLPGANPVTIRASLKNVANVPVTLTALAQTDKAVALTQQILWKTDSSIGIAAETPLSNSGPHSLGTLQPGESTVVTFTLTLPASVGNEYQGQTVSLNLSVRAVQQGF